MSAYRGRSNDDYRDKVYTDTRARSNYSSTKRNDLGKGSSRYNSRRRSRSRSPKRSEPRRSRSRSWSRTRQHGVSHRSAPSRSPDQPYESEGLRITIESNRGSSHKDPDMDTRRRSRSRSKHSGSRGRSRNRVNSPRSQSQEAAMLHRSSLSPDQSLRITVGNDRYLQKRLGPPVTQHEYETEVQTKSDRSDYQHRRRDREFGRTGRDAHNDRHTAESHRWESRAPNPDVATESYRERMSPVTPSREPAEDSAFQPQNVREYDHKTRGQDFVATENPEKHAAGVLPMVPGLAASLVIEDEDKFLYGDDATEMSGEECPVFPDRTLPVLSKSIPREVDINQFGDSDYRQKAPSRLYEPPRDAQKYREPSLERHLYGSSSAEDTSLGPSSSGENRFSLRRVGRDSFLRYGDEDLNVHQVRTSPADLNSSDVRSDTTDSFTRASREQSQTLDSTDDGKSVDPTIQNILKSIGFDFEMSQLMQQRAQAERAKQLKKQELENTIRKGDSFRHRGLIVSDLNAVFGNKGSFSSADVEETGGMKRKTMVTAESYEERAKRYREEQARTFLEEQTRVHPMDYLTSTCQKQERDNKERNLYSSAREFSAEGDSHNRSLGMKSKEVRDYKDKLFEDEDELDQIYSKSKPPEKDKLRGGAAGSDDGRGQTKDDTHSRKSDGRNDTRTHHKRHSQTLGEEQDRNLNHRGKKQPSPPQTLAKNDLRNVLIASDKASNRTVLPPKVDRDRNRQVSPKKEDFSEGKTKPVLSAKELEKLEQEKEERKKRLAILETELGKLRKQQGEMMRKKQKQKDGHKDPLLVENSKLQDEITKQITVLRKSVGTPPVEGTAPPTSVKFEVEVTPKLAKGQTILVESSSESDGELKSSRAQKTDTKHKCLKSPSKPAVQKEDRVKSRKRSRTPSSSSVKAASASADDKKSDKKHRAESKPKPKFHVNYEFFDPGNHWCRKCNVLANNVAEVFQHLQKKQHTSKLDQHDRPWALETPASPKTKEKKGQTVSQAIQGIEFLIPVHAFYCRLCTVFSGDAKCAEKHLKTEQHFKNYQNYVNDNPFYEQRLKLDKAAGASTATNASDDTEKDVPATEKIKRTGKDDDVAASERVRQQKRAIERKLREQEEEDERKRKEREEQTKRRTETEKVKETQDKIRFELPATGKFGRVSFAQQRKKIEDAAKRQQEAKEKSAKRAIPQFSFGKAPPAFTSVESSVPRIDASTFMKKLNEEKQRNQLLDNAAEDIAGTLPLGKIPLPKENLAKETASHPMETENAADGANPGAAKDQDDDLKLLGIDPDSTSAMNISHKPPQMASRKPNGAQSTSGAATTAANLCGVFNSVVQTDDTEVGSDESFDEYEVLDEVN